MINSKGIEFIKAHRQDDVRELALSAARYPGIDVAEAVVQIAAWQTARKKLPLWAATDGILYPKHLSMEQCSSQVTAEYKAKAPSLPPPIGEGNHPDGSVFNVLDVENKKPTSFTDLTAGFGVDATMIGRHFDHVTYVERQAELCEIARNNLPLLGIKDAEVINGDAVEVLERLPHQTLIYLDPARRDSNGGKTVAISDCTPDVTQIMDKLLDKADRVMIKLSPMLDITTVLRELKCVTDVHIVSVDGECKEVVAVAAPHSPQGGVTMRAVHIHCTNIVKGVTQTMVVTADEEQHAVCHYTDTLGRYLYEPNASVMKAAAFKTVAERYGLKKLHPSSHLYTNDTLVKEFPGRAFEVVGTSSMGKKEVQKLMAGEKRANLTVRNFPASVAELRKRLKLSEGGTTYLFATTMADDTHILIKTNKIV